MNPGQPSTLLAQWHSMIMPRRRPLPVNHLLTKPTLHRVAMNVIDAGLDRIRGPEISIGEKNGIFWY
jgi:hypothetical protein